MESQNRKGFKIAALMNFIRKILPFLILFCSLFIASCNTTGKNLNENIYEADYLPLDEGAFIYILTEAKKTQAILEALNLIPVNDKQFLRILDKTQTALIAVYSENQKLYQVTAYGKYPSSSARFALAMSRDWKRTRTKDTREVYWHSKRDYFSIAVNKRQANVLIGSSLPAGTGREITADSPFYTKPGIKPPEGFDNFRKNTIFSCWIVNPANTINKYIAEADLPFEIPADQFFISLDEDLHSGRYLMHMRFDFSSVSQAKGISSMMGIARNHYQPVISMSGIDLLMNILFTNIPFQKDNSLTITSVLGADRIALLLKLFAI